MAKTTTNFNSYTSEEVVNSFFKFVDKRDVFAKMGMEVLEEFCKTWQKAIDRGHMVDVGCASGSLTVEFRSYFQRITGVDISATQITKAKQSFSEFRTVEFLVGSAENLPVDDASADVIFSIFAVQDFDLEKFKEECKRVLKPNGIVMLVTHMPCKVALLGGRSYTDAKAGERATKLWNDTILKFKNCADEMDHPEWHIFDKYHKLSEEPWEGFFKSRDDERKYDVEMTLRDMRESYYSVPFHLLPEPRKILERFFAELKEQLDVLDVGDEDLILRLTNTMSVVILSKI